MAGFTNPFPGIPDTRPMNQADLIRALRLDLTAEEDAVHLYTAHADATDNPLAERVLRSIADEEKVHVGEFLKLIEILDPGESQLLKDGAMEVEDFREFARVWRR